jgi:predicted Zn finger-like uncharacterized protein
MSLITQCPACATMFKVVPDQLRISDGWVRCGQCDEVFDANANLSSDRELTPEVLHPQAPQVSPQDEEWESSLRFATDSHATDRRPVDVAFEVDDAVIVRSAGSLPGDAPDASAAGAAETDFTEPESGLDPLLDLRPGHARDEPVIAPAASPVASKPSSDVEPRYAQVQVKTVEPAELPKLSFMRQSRGANVWQRTRVRVLLSLMAVFLVAALALQLVVHSRDRIAATEPNSKAALIAVCAWLNCTLQPVRQIESVVIDSSTFTKLRADVYRLNFTLKSTAAITLAVPALELTLTDMQDQAVVRRVVLATEMGTGKETLEAGAELSAAIPIYVKSGGGAERISGYRLLAFYP